MVSAAHLGINTTTDPDTVEVPTVTKDGGKMDLSEFEGKDLIRKRKKGSVRELKLTVSRKLRPRSKPHANKDVIRESVMRFEDQMKQVRSEYREQYMAWKEQHDKASVDKFFAFRDKVLEYRRKKRDLVINNVRNHEEYMFHLGNEYDRLRLEKNTDRINKESIESAMRIDALKRLKDESHTYITAENLDDHIAEQLDPERLVVPTIFYNRLGINDEVNLEIHKTVVRQMQYEQAKKSNNREKVHKYEYESLLISDDMYPHERLVERSVDFDEIRENAALEMLQSQEDVYGDPEVARRMEELKDRLGVGDESLEDFEGYEDIDEAFSEYEELLEGEEEEHEEGMDERFF